MQRQKIRRYSGNFSAAALNGHSIAQYVKYEKYVNYGRYENYATYVKYVKYEKYAGIVYIWNNRKEFGADGHK